MVLERRGRQRPGPIDGHARGQPRIRRAALRPGDLAPRLRCARSSLLGRAAGASCRSRSSSLVRWPPRASPMRSSPRSSFRPGQPGEGRAYAKFAFFERPAASVAVRLSVRDGAINDAYVAVGSLTDVPTMVPDAGQALVGTAATAGRAAGSRGRCARCVRWARHRRRPEWLGRLQAPPGGRPPGIHHPGRTGRGDRPCLS